MIAGDLFKLSIPMKQTTSILVALKNPPFVVLRDTMGHALSRAKPGWLVSGPCLRLQLKRLEDWNDNSWELLDLRTFSLMCLVIETCSQMNSCT